MKRRTTHRWLGLALALVCAGGPLSSVAHLLLVRHVTCPEHGELVHADGRVAAKRVASQPGLGATDRDAAAHAHDHCIVLSPAPPAASVERPRVAAAAVAAVADGITPLALPPAAPVPLLHLAPKSSPPA